MSFILSVQTSTIRFVHTFDNAASVKSVYWIVGDAREW